MKSRALGTPLDMYLVRKVGVSGHEDVVCALTPEPFHALGLRYEDFSQTSDEEGIELLPVATGSRMVFTLSNNAEPHVITRRRGQGQRAVSVIAHQGERSW